MGTARCPKRTLPGCPHRHRQPRRTRGTGSCPCRAFVRRHPCRGALRGGGLRAMERHPLRRPRPAHARWWPAEPRSRAAELPTRGHRARCPDPPRGAGGGDEGPRGQPGAPGPGIRRRHRNRRGPKRRSHRGRLDRLPAARIGSATGPSRHPGTTPAFCAAGCANPLAGFQPHPGARLPRIRARLFTGLRNADTRRGHQGRLARDRRHHAPRCAQFRLRAEAAASAAGIRADVAARGRCGCLHRDQLHLYQHPRRGLHS